MVELADVAVVGAGLAGIAAARRLRAAGLKVVLLEARDAPGGRARATRKLGHPVDLGASWLHGVEDHPLYDMAVKLGLEHRFTDYQSLRVYREDGSPDPATLSAMECFEEAVMRLGRHAKRRESVADRLQLLAKKHRKGLSRPLQDFLITAFLEEEYAADIDELAAAALDEGRAMRGPDAILRGSYSTLTEALSEDLDIRLNCIVDSVDYADARVRVATRCGCFEVAQVIVTVPLGVLQAGNIAFTPALPAAHQRAIHALGMGLVNKLYLEFPRVFWDAGIQVVGYQSARRGRWMSWYDYSAVTGVPILLGFNAGAGAAEVEALDDAASVNDAMVTLRRIYGQDIPPPRAAAVTRWGQDRFARGAYSFLKVGARSSQRKTLARPIGGRLLLAGEHTDRRYPATTHGAWRAGIRAAKCLLTLRDKAR